MTDNAPVLSPSRSRVRGVAIVGGSAAPTMALSAAACWDGGLLPAALAAVLPLCFFFAVVCPAVWSKDKRRRDAALVVLDRLLRGPAA